MPGLTAKVFRTYNASDTLERQLPGEEALKGLSVAEKVSNLGGLRVGILFFRLKHIATWRGRGSSIVCIMCLWCATFSVWMPFYFVEGFVCSINGTVWGWID